MSLEKIDEAYKLLRGHLFRVSTSVAFGEWPELFLEIHNTEALFEKLYAEVKSYTVSLEKEAILAGFAGYITSIKRGI